MRRCHSEPNYNAEPEPPTCPTRFYPPPPPPPPRNRARKTTLRLTALALLLATLAAVAGAAGGGLLGPPHAGEAAFVTQTTTDYDTDDDGLIDITTLAQLDAIRHDLNGNGDATHADYVAAFPSRDTNAATRMGCPLGSCTGYELMNNLDFDENDDDRITSADTTYWNSGAGWTPLGGADESNDANNDFTATFEGNSHTISNLYISLNTTAANVATFVGLFADITGGTVRNVGLLNPSVSNTRSGDASFIRVGALTGRNGSGSTVSGVSVSGGSVTSTLNGTGLSTLGNLAGCLVGYNGGTVTTSHASCAATATGTYADTNNMSDTAGGLIGRNDSVLSDSYATGEVESSFRSGGVVGDARGSSRTRGSYAIGNVSATKSGGAAGGLLGFVSIGSRITNSYATGNVTVASNSDAGGLVGRTGASNVQVNGSYATGNVSTTGNSNNLGGLVGYLRDNGDAIGSYATGNVSTTGNSNTLGGLVGRTDGIGTSIIASYAIGRVSTTGTGNTLGGLVASVAGNTTVTNSYWDSTINPGLGGGGTAQTTTALQTPDEYGTTGIYSAWDVNVDGQTGNDDPWDFGTTSQYPILKFGHNALSIAEQRAPQRTTVDYDRDNDNLIDITTLTQLNGIRYDLDGDGRNTGDDAVNYYAAFSGITQGMGCPAACIGYELMNDLDFDYDGSGSTHTAGVIDSGDAVAATAAYFDSATGWTPIGGHTSAPGSFTATFEGNNNTIDNLYINLTTNAADVGEFVGLFADIGATGVVRNLALVDPYVLNTRNNSGQNEFGRAGALAGRNAAGGAVRGVYINGGSVLGVQNTATPTGVGNLAGCLLGYNAGAVHDSYASCAASATGTDDAADTAGGLIAQNGGTVSLSYATGTVTAHQTAGGLVGDISAGAVTTSYATGAVTVSGGNGVAGGLVGNSAGTITASYAAGAVATTGTGTSGNPNRAGGLVGNLGTGGTITASYATGTVTTSGAGNGRVGGLVGLISGTTSSPATITASYAVGGVTSTGSGSNILGGLVGGTSGTSSQTNVHWNNDMVANGGTGQAASAGSANTAGRTGAQLKTPTDYGAAAANAFYSWNVDLDGDSSADDPWDFGTSSDYPVLSYGGISLRAQGRTPVDYDADNDGLIDIDSLAKLNAVRHDLDGNGQHDGGAGDTAYNAVFANRDRSAAGLMGCPLADHDDDADTPEQAHCTGYELMNDLDFDTDGDGQTYTISGGAVTVDAGDTDNFFDASEGWAPIGNNATGYSGVFEGNRHIIDHLFINVPATSSNDVARERVGLFAKVDRGGVIRGVSLTDVYMNRERTGSGIVYAGALVGQSFGTVTASSATGEVRATDENASSSSQVGGLVGESGNRSAVNASWADVVVTVDGPMVRAGGLVGTSLAGKIVASHAYGDVNVDDSPNGRVGGLVGSLNLLGAVPATVTASYARGEVAGSGSTTTGRVLGGLVGGGSSASGVTDSYWDNSTSGTNQASSYGGGEGKTTAELQSITGYTGIYANWNVDVDGQPGNDDPWHFGANDQYPTLKYGGFSPAAQGSSGTDYDTDSDGLIEITTLAQLDAIRLDLDGDGRPTSVLAYRAAFPVGDVGSDAEVGAAGRMGCSHSEPVVRTCLGYELMSDLDFDTDGDGSTHTAGVGDSDDDYYNGGAGWAPIGGHGETTHQAFTAILDGNGNDIENLYLNLETDAANAGTYVGLFADLTGTVRNVGLADPYVKNARSGAITAVPAFVRTGALAGRNSVGGTVRGSYVTGGSVIGDQSAVTGTPTNLVGCLLGYNAGTVRDSSASCAATATGTDDTRDQAGGLVGENAAITVNSVTGAGLIANSHATGNVTSDRNAGGLVGVSTTGGRVTGSYAEGDVTSTGANGRAGGLLGLISAGTVVSDSYAIGDVRVSGSNSIAGGLVGKAQNADTTVTGSYATGAVTASGAGVRNLPNQLGNLLGGLVGELTTGAQITASYATGAVTATTDADNSILGGLVGHMSEADTLVLAAYATGSVTANGGGTNNVGGLLGELDDIENNIDSSYATGAVSATGTGLGVVNSEGGLVGALISPALASQVANSYYDNTADGAGLMVSPGGGSGQTTNALQTPVGYTGIYSAWNRDLDNADTDDNLATGGDDPWHFGGSSQYPVLQHNRGPLDIARQLTPVPTPADYDLDNDNLIDVVNLAQLNAIRHDLNGDGAGMTGAAAAGYLSAYPGYTTGMGCPGTCNGYELTANLDFDTNGDGMVNASDEIADFRTIGGTYSATFQGNGHTISNMQITNNELGHKGLFGELSPNGKIYAVGLIEPVLSNGGGANGRFGALVGYNLGAIYASWVRGGAVSTNQDDTILGGLVGKNGSSVSGQNDYGKIYASYSTATVASAGHEFIDSGGLVGNNLRGTIVASYAAGAVTGSGANSEYGCLTGVASSSGIPPVSSVITSSYYEGTGEGRVCTRGGAGMSRSNLQLQEPTGYTAGGIYAGWNLDLDNADGDNDLATGGDDPWDFRVGHYPVLKYGSAAAANVDIQRPLLAEAGAAVEAYSGQTVTLDGSGSRAPSGAAYRWTRMPTEATPMVTINGATTATPTFLAPTGLTSDTTMTFRLTLTAGGRSVYDDVTVSIVAVRPNQLLSLSLTDSEGDAVGLAPPFVSLTYDYRASVANQIASVAVTPSLLEGSTMTLNGQAVSSGAEVEVPLKYRGNQITIVVTPPEPEPDETMNGETTDGDTTDETVAETPCSVENDGVKPCTYTVTVNRAVPPRLAFVPRSLTIEEGGTGTYTVELDTRILTGAVTIAIASDNPDVTVSPTEVTLRPLDMAPRTITVTAASDADRNDETATLTHTANGAHYYDVIATVGVTVNDTTAPPPAPDPALSVSVASLRLAEGSSGAYTVALATRPDDNVTVTIASDNPDVTTRPASLSFTTANWNTAQRVTVSAASDGDTANDTATLTHTASGGGYGDAPSVSVAVSVTDDDTAGLAITPTVLNLIENGISAYIVSLTAQPSGNVTVAIASDNPDVTVRPAALTFTPTNWATPQAVLVITRADAGGGDELATLRMTAQGGGYAGQTGQVLASVDDKLAPLPVNADAPAGVSVYGPPGTTATATVSAAGADTPTVATGAGFGIGSAVAVSVSDAPDDGLEICLPVSDELRADAGSALILTLLRYAAGSWTELPGARDLGDRVCAAGVTGQAAYATAYALPPGTVLDLAASVGDTPGTIALSWTPPAAGASQVAVVVNVADDTDYCLDTLPGLDASTYTCAGRRAGQTYVALLIVLLPDGGYTLANIVRFDLPAAASQ